MNEVALLLTLSNINRTAYHSRICAAQKMRDRTLENSVKVLNYDPSIGHYKVKNTAGQIFSARAISNGAFAIGDQVSLVAPIGGIPIIDAMPR